MQVTGLAGFCPACFAGMAHLGIGFLSQLSLGKTLFAKHLETCV